MPFELQPARRDEVSAAFANNERLRPRKIALLPPLDRPDNQPLKQVTEGTERPKENTEKGENLRFKPTPIQLSVNSRFASVPSVTNGQI